MDIARGLLQDNVVDGTSPRIQTYRNLRQLNPASEHDESLWVYGRRGKPCRKCGTPIEIEEDGPRRPLHLLVPELSDDPLRMRVDVEALAAEEAAERDAGLLREIDRQARRRRDGGNQRHAGQQRFLHQLERRAARDQQDRRIERMPVLPAACGRRSCRRRCGGRRLRPTTAALPDRSNRPAACRPPVDSNTACDDRRRSGSDAITSALTVQSPRTADTRACSDSIVRRPHRPHDEVIVTWRRSPSRAARRSTASAVTVTLMMLSRPSSVTSSQYSIVPISSAPRITSSASRKPAARSRSAPGVRMITAKLAPLTRTSIGSSTATRVALAARPGHGARSSTSRMPGAAPAGGLAHSAHSALRLDSCISTLAQARRRRSARRRSSRRPAPR